jgi:hypothetical protein
MNSFKSLLNSIKSSTKNSDNEKTNPSEATTSFPLKKIVKRSKKYQVEDKFLDNLDYIIDYSTNLYKIVNDRKYLKCVKYLCDRTTKCGKYNQEFYTYLAYSQLVKNLVDLLESCLPCTRVAIIEYYGRKQDILLNLHEDHNLDYCCRVTHIFYCLTNLISYATDSRLFAKKFNEQGGTHVLFEFLSNKQFIEDCHIVAEVDMDEIKGMLILIRNIILSLYNLSKIEYFDMNKAGQILLPFSECINFNQTHFFLTHMLLAKSLSSHDFDDLAQNSTFKEDLIEMIKRLSSSIEVGGAHKMARIQIDLDDEQCFMGFIKTNEKCFSLSELVDAFYDVFFADEHIYELFIEKDIKTSMIRVLLNGNEPEQEQAIKLLLQFSFEDTIAFYLSKDSILVNRLKANVKSSSNYRSLTLYCEILLWLFDNEMKRKSQSTINSNTTEFKDKNSDSFISNSKTNSDNSAARILSQSGHSSGDDNGNGTLSNKISEYNNDSFDTNYFYELINYKSSIPYRNKKVFLSHEKRSRNFCIKIEQELNSSRVDTILYSEVQKFKELTYLIKSSDCILMCKNFKNFILGFLYLKFFLSFYVVFILF